MIRRSSPDDRKPIRQLLEAAFEPSVYEARLCEIVSRGVDHHEWVFEQGSRIVGHILYTPATHGADVLGYHLAPVAVHAEFQGDGIGSRLIRETLASEPISGSSVFVLGDPGFYERFGFEGTTSAVCPFDANNEHFRALRWADSEDQFTIGYLPAFQEAEHDGEATQ